MEKGRKKREEEVGAHGIGIWHTIAKKSKKREQENQKEGNLM